MSIFARWASTSPMARDHRLDELHGMNTREPSGAVDAGHVLRHMQDEAGHWLNLRPHTSPMQVRLCQAHAARHAREIEQGLPMPEIRVIGRAAPTGSTATPRIADVPPMRRPVDRRERQLQGLEGCLHRVLPQVFESDDLQLRFRPSFFPFTEPRPRSHRVCQRRSRASGWRWPARQVIQRGAQLRLTGAPYGFAFGMGRTG